MDEYLRIIEQREKERMQAREEEVMQQLEQIKHVQ